MDEAANRNGQRERERENEREVGSEMDVKHWLRLLRSAYFFDMGSTYVSYCVHNLCTEVLCGAPGLFFSCVHTFLSMFLLFSYIVKQNDIQ